jgi:dTDP-4-dehydrorhamnose 3,5-epimerase/CDP-3, 6-dideoxy-D-glycero-D-glycero-4-hexulose-5-epimerase
MKVEELSVPGAKLIVGRLAIDNRGSFFKPYNYENLLKMGIKFDVQEVFYSVSRKGVIRGMHFQNPPAEQEKIVTVIKGSIMDVILDLRTDSEYFGRFITIRMNENDGCSVLVPKGTAHGFLGLDLENIVLYLADASYSRENEDGIRYDSFGYDWGVKNPVLNERDLGFDKFENFISPF